MNLDLQTFVIVLSLLAMLQVVALYIQYRADKLHHGLVWWLLGTAAWMLGFTFNLLRGDLLSAEIATAASAFFFIAGSALLYTGILRYFDRQEHRWPLILTCLVFSGAAAVFTFIQDNPAARILCISLAMASLSYLIAYNLAAHSYRPVRTAAYYLALVFLVNAVFYTQRAVSPLLDALHVDLLRALTTQAMTDVDMLVTSSLMTFGFIIMVNQRLTAENSEVRENLELIFNTSPDAVVISRIADGCFIRVNDGFETTLGYSRHEIVGRESLDLHIWVDPDSRQNWVTGLMQNGMLENLEAKFRRKDGSIFPGLVSARLITLDGMQHIISVTRDITERKRADDLLWESEEKFRTMTENSSDIIWHTDRNFVFTYVSPADERVRGFKREEVVGKEMWSLLKPEAVEGVRRFNAGRLEAEASGVRTGVASFELELLCKDGSWLWTEASVSPHHDRNGVLVGYHGITRDISLRKRSEAALHDANTLLEQHVQERTIQLQEANIQLEKASRMKDEFLASMSHELRTPLTGILGLTEVLQLETYGPLGEKQKTALGHIQESGRRLLELINDLLDFSRMETGTFVLDAMPCSLGSICQASLRAIAEPARARHLQSNFSIYPDTIIVNADNRRLKQVITNLLSNAVKFTQQGGRIGIDVKGSRADHLVFITVWDSGIGIREEDVSRLFQPFVQLDARLAREYPGTGLGLAMTRRLVELHGGSIAIQSVPSEGSRFTVSLPWME